MRGNKHIGSSLFVCHMENQASMLNGLEAPSSSTESHSPGLVGTRSHKTLRKSVCTAAFTIVTKKTYKLATDKERWQKRKGGGCT